jgi:hypothetical protein
MCVPRIMVIYVHLGLRWQQLGEISVTEFFGHDNVGNWLKVAYQSWGAWNHTSIDRKWEFSVYKQELWTLCLWPSCGTILKSFLEWVSLYIFYLLSYMSKLTDMCLMRAQNFQMVGPTRNTPNGFDASGNGDLPPPPPMTPVETFMAAQTKVLRQILQTQ